MKNNQKGFTLVELIGVIAISSIIIAPLLFSLVNNFEVNTRQIKRSAASLVTEAAVLGFQNMLFDDLQRHYVTSTAIEGPGYLLVNSDNCNMFYDYDIQRFPSSIKHVGTSLEALGDTNIPSLEVDVFDPNVTYGLNEGNRGICNSIFDLQVIDESFTAEDYIVIIYRFSVENETERAEWEQKVEAINPTFNTPLPVSVQNTLNSVPTSPSPDGLYRVLVWVRYGDRTSDTILRTGLISQIWAPIEDETGDTGG